MRTRRISPGSPASRYVTPSTSGAWHEDYLVMSTYAMIFDAVNDVPVLSSANSPLASYPGYLLNYENPYGAGRIQVV